MELRHNLTALALGAAILIQVGPALATELEVTHWWTSGGEAEAVKVFADAFNKGGDTWVDAAIGGSGDVARSVIFSRIIGGKPMGATQLNHGRQAEELVEEGLMLDLTELADKEGWRELVRPSSLLDACTVEGRTYCVPVNIHSMQWMWLSRNAYKNAGLSAPKNWNEFVESAPKLRTAGITPLAVGLQTWQIEGMFGVIRMGLGGIDLFRLTDIERDPQALRGPEMESIWNAFAQARELDDPNNSIQNWNDATTQVINASHAAQIMGDWAQSEFQIAGQTAGIEYDCLPGLGLAPALDTGGDAFYFPVQEDPEKTAAQLRMASMMISKTVQVAFNLKKGSLPVRGDVELSTANDCMKKGLKILQDPANVVPDGNQLFSQDTRGQLHDLLAQFWTDSAMSARSAHEAWATIIEQAD